MNNQTSPQEPTAQAGCCGAGAATTDIGQPTATAVTTDQIGDVPVAGPVVVIGAGPVGLATAAHLAERGLGFLVLEAGAEVGPRRSREWGHVRLFSPWRYDTDAAARRLLEATGWSLPDPDHLPTGAELVDDYLIPLSRVPALDGRVRTRTRVLAVTRRGADATRTIGRDERPLLVRFREADGTVRDIDARAVIDASGTWGNANP
ncbi:FAD-dependent oxidoreductase, partial [Actinomadura sp. CNU-125]|uniref:FAD-dependent oxidoreductase n=1 Tax=Actinomadura sp. CNU-125 TaxID=1904961 RepID=UPI001177ADB3